MKVQTEITEYDNDNNVYLIEITAEYVDFERGERDSFGVPLEPDFDAHFIIDDIYIGDKNYSLHELAELLDYSFSYVSEMIQDALGDKLESDYELYNELQYENNSY
jgi:hypothetical protein